MIEIKQSRKLHSSGYRMMTIKGDDKVISECADVLRINFGNLFDGLNLDITKDGTIRIWSYKYDLVAQEHHHLSDVIFQLRDKNV